MGDFSIELDFDNAQLLESKEQALLRLLNSYEDTFRMAINTLQPQMITNYLYKLSQSFHSYYGNIKKENYKLQTIFYMKKCCFCDFSQIL